MNFSDLTSLNDGPAFGRFMLFGYDEGAAKGGLKDVLWHGDQIQDAEGLLGYLLPTQGSGLYIFDRIKGEVALGWQMDDNRDWQTSICQHSDESLEAFEARCQEALRNYRMLIICLYRNRELKLLEPVPSFKS